MPYPGFPRRFVSLRWGRQFLLVQLVVRVILRHYFLIVQLVGAVGCTTRELQNADEMGFFVWVQYLELNRNIFIFVEDVTLQD